MRRGQVEVMMENDGRGISRVRKNRGGEKECGVGKWEKLWKKLGEGEVRESEVRAGEGEWGKGCCSCRSKKRGSRRERVRGKVVCVCSGIN